MSLTTCKDRILIIDDDVFTSSLVSDLLAYDYHVSVSNSAKSGLKEAQSDSPPDLILLDIEMPEVDGYQTCQQLKASSQTNPIPVIFLTVKNDVIDEAYGLELGAVDYIHKPISAPILKARIKSHLLLKKTQRALEEKNARLRERVIRRTQEISRTQDAAILALTSLAETRHEETGNHIVRTQEYVKCLAIELRSYSKYHTLLTSDTIEALYKSAPLHDIGKVGVPDRVLMKPGKLTPDEYEEIKKHTTYGMRALKHAETMLGTNSFLRTARDIAYTHHEKWDGTGYPRGLKGEQIPLSGRLMAIADCYDAIRCKRVYKEACSHQDAYDFIVGYSGSHFDPTVVKAFQQKAEEFQAIAERFGLGAQARTPRRHAAHAGV